MLYLSFDLCEIFYKREEISRKFFYYEMNEQNNFLFNFLLPMNLESRNGQQTHDFHLKHNGFFPLSLYFKFLGHP